MECKQKKPPTGIEPATFRLQGGCSTTKLKWLIDILVHGLMIKAINKSFNFQLNDSEKKIAKCFLITSAVDVILVNLVNKDNDVTFFTSKSRVALVSAPDAEVIYVNFYISQRLRVL